MLADFLFRECERTLGFVVRCGDPTRSGVGCNRRSLSGWEVGGSVLTNQYFYYRIITVLLGNGFTLPQLVPQLFRSDSTGWPNYWS